MHQKKIEFLARLFKLSACYDEFIDFLRAEKMLDEFELGTLKHESDKAKYLFGLLENLRKTDKLLLLDFEWHILPVEILKLTIVTTRQSKEFYYSI